MGIESDQLVYDYLSQVGDLAQRTLPSSQRMRVVTQLRTNIDRVRAAEGAETVAATKRVLARFGTPSDIVEAVSDDPAKNIPQVVAQPRAPATRLPRLPRPRSGENPRKQKQAPPPPQTVAPHLAGEDELERSAGPDWWRVEEGPFGGGRSQGGDMVPGFTGGIEIPELLRPPPEEEEEEEEEEVEEELYDEESEDAPARGGAALALLARLGPLGTLSVLALLGGAILGQPLAVLAGLLLAYGSQRLSRVEAKWAAIGMPVIVAAGTLIWLWGRNNGRWGAPIPDDQMSAEMGDALPWAVRAAAVATTLFLLWRARRRMPIE